MECRRQRAFTPHKTPTATTTLATTTTLARSTPLNDSLITYLLELEPSTEATESPRILCVDTSLSSQDRPSTPFEKQLPTLAMSHPQTLDQIDQLAKYQQQTGACTICDVSI